jgi:outer membrane protein TolC
MEQSPIPRILLLATAFLAACSTEAYRKEADAEVYGILGNKRREVLGKDASKDRSAFSIEAVKHPLRDGLLAEIKKGKAPLVQLNLDRALEIAAENSRDFQSRKERLYLSALSLTGQRNRYSTIFSGSANGQVEGTGKDKSSQGTASGSLNASKILSSGARILGGFLNNFIKVFTSGGGWNVSSLLSLSITQPLLQGFGKEIALEPLTQAERNVIYEVRNFERFRRTFCIDIVNEYLNLLELTNTLKNQVANLKSLRLNRERAEAMARAGRLPPFQVDQARQQEFSAQDRTISARSRMKTALDRFKITLGLPIESELQLDRSILQKFQSFGVEAQDISSKQAITIALAQRLDVQNSREQLEDAERQVRVAADALRIGLDLSASINVPNQKNKPLKMDFHKFQWEVGLALDLPLNKVAERNVYRSSLIALQAEKRNFSLFIDQVKQQIRGELRDLELAFRSFKIQEQAVTLAKQRVESTLMLIDAGRASTRDYLEAEQSLLASQNALTSALVDYVLRKLQLLRDLELLDVGQKGLSLDPSTIRRWTQSETKNAARSSTKGTEKAKETTPPKGTKK